METHKEIHSEFEDITRKHNSMPIFIFAAGWRSGSTFLQRMIISTHQALIWGETMGGINLLANAALLYKDSLAGPDDPRSMDGVTGNGGEQFRQFLNAGKYGAHKWIANLNPPLETVYEAFRSILKALYANTALQLGYPRWGIKEVQSGIETANFLRLLYPDAKFIFLVRNPLDCLTSIKRRNWIGRANDRNRLRFYATHWARLAREFRHADFGYLLRYEDLLAQDGIIKQLQDYLEIEGLSKEFAQQSRVDWPSYNEQPLTLQEKLFAIWLLKREMAYHGYV
jgi:hypothetical protein